MDDFGKPDGKASEPHTIRRAVDDLVPLDPLIGTVVADKFAIRELVGTGGWSRVYRAEDLSDGRNVAIKVLHSHLLFDAESVTRFAREAESGASLDHPNICKVFDYDRLATGQPFIVMEFMDGESLATMISRERKLVCEIAVRIFLDCCRGIAAAHARGIIHRDIKPANIFILKDSTVKILDFGLAKIIAARQADITHTGTAFGTVQYMSPQQVVGGRIDLRSDIYSLGCVMYEALSGRKVFIGQTAYEVMDQHVRMTPARISEVGENVAMPKALEALVMRALEKDPQNRFQTIEEMMTALESLDFGQTCENTGKSDKLHHLSWPALVVIAIVFAFAISLLVYR